LYLCVFTLGVFRLALTATQALQYNVTQFVGTTVVISCVDSMGNTIHDPPFWIQNPGRNVIYSAFDEFLVDPTKYSVVSNGSSVLAVMNLQLSDATTYCCVSGVTDYCANVVVIGMLMVLGVLLKAMVGEV